MEREMWRGGGWRGRGRWRGGGVEGRGGEGEGGVQSEVFGEDVALGRQNTDEHYNTEMFLLRTKIKHSNWNDSDDLATRHGAVI